MVNRSFVAGGVTMATIVILRLEKLLAGAKSGVSFQV